MDISFLTSNRLQLRAVEPEDLEVLYTIENTPQNWEVSTTTTPYSHFVLKSYLDHCMNDLYAERQLRLMIVSKEHNGAVVGTIDMVDFDPRNQHASVGIAVMKEYQRSGFACEALELLCTYCFDYLHLRLLYAYVSETNHASLSLFTACGFVQCGLLKDWIRTKTGYCDVRLVQRITSPIESIE